ncbi:MAG: hypothetical protein FD143_3640 [Ignavibacteria bacterium]|nr:MAG: hypothetical protein FD143_3640 [Ignavibacteria bacterium]
MEEVEDSEEAVRRRASSFSKEEDMKLVEGYKEYKEIMDAKLSGKISAKDKGDVWRKLTARINANNAFKRSEKEISSL